MSKQIEEISKPTLLRYVAKAAANHGLESFKKGHSDDPEEKRKADRKADKRYAGINKAAEKLARESVELDEISKKTLGSYIQGATDDLDMNASERGFSAGHGVASGRNTQANPGGSKSNPIDKDHARSIRKSHNRRNGIIRAAKKLVPKSSHPLGYVSKHNPLGGISVKKEDLTTDPNLDIVEDRKIDVGINNQTKKVRSNSFHKDMAKVISGHMNISDFNRKHNR